MEFRKLKRDEIEVRVQLKKNTAYATALLYMTARAPMNLLDEAVGAGNWYQKFTFINDNAAMCDLTVYDEDRKEWVTKQDIGVGNDGMSKQDGQGKANQIKSVTSDAFKRASVMWGVGRELYTGPKIEFPTQGMINISGNYTYDTFDLTGLDYDEDGRINYLHITDITTNKVVYIYDCRPEQLTPDEIKKIKENFEKLGIKSEQVCTVLGLKKFEDITRSLCRQWYTKEGIEKIKSQTGEQAVANLPNTQKGVKVEEKTDKPKDFMSIDEGVQDDALPFK